MWNLSASCQDNHDDGGNNQCNSQHDLPVEGFVENEASDDDGSEWFQGTEYGCHGAADAFDAIYQTDVGDERTDDCQGGKVTPLKVGGDWGEVALTKGFCSKDECTDEHDVEHEL